MAVEEKTLSQWRREGWTPEEISTFSKLGIVLADTGEDALNDRQRKLIETEAHDRWVFSTAETVEEERQALTKFVVSVIEAAERQAA